jgi:DNA-binding response OmpR family regulator
MATTHEDEWAAVSTDAAPATLRVLLYSDHVEAREQVRRAVGSVVAADLPPVEWLEVATALAAVDAVEAGGLDLLVLDGESGKVGGMALARQFKDEIFRCPPVLLLTGRPQDAWLAAWSAADATVCRPLDPFELQKAVAGLLRGRAA